ncbi:LytTR family DNA-binding domain-containing protein [Parabacteroides sp. PF5-9]|uniref:LytR/AlgR family response regulator transcription factor n=1 Tax=Parabacteroides sp. PF5-9 TaxID=1742404 RepID=UPI002475B109|nr:LytTR family DNA-binding domain-containing protein [Parabacteroides sp. PF5-9]MDH6357304.1 two-component system response regulator LytT [Parabacteroides sp. PF5-9]
MKILIVEDETATYDAIVDILKNIDRSIKVVGNTESVKQTVNWLMNNPNPDLILMDIHLSDGSAFNIFHAITVDTPIVFITAYDQYAIDAFKVNSIDYILKPVNHAKMLFAIEKFQKLNQPDRTTYISQVSQLVPSGKYIERVLLPINDRLIPISLADISFFYTTGRNTQLFLKEGKQYPYSKTLDAIIQTVDPTKFFRANKQFVIAKESITNITIWFDNRLLITMDIDTPERIYISKKKAAEFKQWMVS